MVSRSTCLLLVAILLGTSIPGTYAKDNNNKARSSEDTNNKARSSAIENKGPGGTCTGAATQCDHVYSTTLCTNFDMGGKSLCDTFFDSCEGLCERSGMKSFNSQCSCNRESLGCDEFGCKSRISCNGTPDCAAVTNSLDCTLTRGCTWTSDPTEAPNGPILSIYLTASTTRSPTRSPTEAPTESPTATTRPSAAPTGPPFLHFTFGSEEEYLNATLTNSTDSNSTEDLLLDVDLVSLTTQKSLRSGGGGLSDKQAVIILDETMDAEMSEEIESSATRTPSWLWMAVISTGAAVYSL